MKNIITVFLLISTLSVSAQQEISIEDVKPLEGKWKGTLTYLDYSSNKSEKINTNILVTIKGASAYELSFYYTDEPDHNNSDLYTIKENGTIVNDAKLIERNVQPDGSLKIVLESKGTDGNAYKSATFHQVIVIGKEIFSITKLVRFDGEEDFFQRNQYFFTRN